MCSVCIVSILRITAFNKSDPKDPTYTSIDTAMWSSIEQSVGIICACLPALRPLFRRLYGSSTHSSAYAWKSTGSHSQSHRSGTIFAPVPGSRDGCGSSTVCFARLSAEITRSEAQSAHELQVHGGRKPGIEASADTPGNGSAAPNGIAVERDFHRTSTSV